MSDSDSQSEKQRWHAFKAQYLEAHPVLAEEMAGWMVMRDELQAKLAQVNREIDRLRKAILVEYRRTQAP